MAEGLEALRGAHVVAARALDLVGEHVLPALAQPGHVERVRLGAHVAQEGQEARRRGAVVAQRLELVGEHRGDRERDRPPLVEHVEQGQVGGGDGLPQPLLAEGPGAVALHVGHVGVEDERELAAG